MFRRLSVLPLFFIIFVLLVLTCNLAFGRVGRSTYGVGSSGPGVGSSTIPGTSSGVGVHRNRSYRSSRYNSELYNYDIDRYERTESVKGNVSGERFFRGHISNIPLTDSRRLPGSSSTNSFMDRSSGSAGDYSMSDGPGYFASAPGVTGELTDSMYTGQSGLSGFDQLQSVTEDLARRVDRLASREKRIEDGLRFESKVYLKQEKSYSQKVESDVNISLDGGLEEVLIDSLTPDGLDQVAQPLSPDEVRLEVDRLLDVEKQERKKQLKDEELEKEAELIDEIEKAKQKKSDEKSDDKSDKADDAKKKLFKDPRLADPDSKQSKELKEWVDNFDSYSDEKFQSYITVADKLLKKGEFYNAIDTYKIAGVWKEGDWRSLMGKAYAHFAAGEYVSSSSCLMRAIELSDESSLKKVDIAELIGDKELYEKHVGEVGVLYDAGRSYKVAFLLAYLSYENGDLKKAKECIDSAASKMDQTNAWKALRRAISN